MERSNQVGGKERERRSIRTGYFLLAAMEAGFGIIYLLAIPSDPKNQWLWGYSLPRVALAAGFLLALAVFIWLARRAWRGAAWVERIWGKVFSSRRLNSRLLGASGLLFVLATTLLLTPHYRFGGWQAYVERLRPLFWWGVLFSAQTVMVLLHGAGKLRLGAAASSLPRQGARVRRGGSFPWRQAALPGGIVLAVLALTWAWIAQTKTGILPNGAVQWKDAGVPLLPGQVWLMLWLTVAAAIGWRALRRASPPRRQGDKTDLLIGLAIWAIAALLWAYTPLPKNFFFPGPYPPDNTIYPFADAASWDMYGQFALIGQGFASGNAFADHAGLSGFLAFMHLLAGQDYRLISALQAALLAVFPAIVYWLGKSMHSRPLGFFAAALAILRELNAFAASTMLDLSHARFLLSEYPVRVGLAAISLWLFLWFRKDPRTRMASALPVGGALALLILLRFNALVMPFAVLAGIVLVFGRDWKGWLRASLLVVLSMTIVLSPWMWRSWTISGNPFFFTGKPRSVLGEGFRFRPPSTPTPAPPTSFKSIPSARNISLQRGYPDSRQSSMPPAVSPGNPGSGIENAAATIINHFAHNLVASVLVLPTDPIFHDLRRTIYETHPYWGKIGGAWRGNLTPAEALGLWINLALLSIGVGLAWRKWKLAGLAPLGIFLAYNLSAALARTSGGRYIVPMDWVVLFYFALGLMQVIFRGAAWFGLDLEGRQPLPEDKAFSWQKGVLALLPFFLFVGAMTIVDRTTPQRYPELTKNEVFDLLTREDILARTDISPQELGVFLADPDARAFFGLSLFPRYYAIGKGEHTTQRTAYSPESFPRLGFTFIGPFGAGQAVLPLLRSPSHFPHAEDVIVVGCIRKPNPFIINVSLDALMVIVPGGDDETVVYTRDPAAPLQCPLPEPSCENNRNCR